MLNNFSNIFKSLGSVQPLQITDECTYTEHNTEGLFFSQSELQQIKEVLRERIATEENWRGLMKFAARDSKLDGYITDASMYYNDANKSAKKIKTLAVIQAKVKHSILTLG